MATLRGEAIVMEEIQTEKTGNTEKTEGDHMTIIEDLQLNPVEIRSSTNTRVRDTNREIGILSRSKIFHPKVEKDFPIKKSFEGTVIAITEKKKEIIEKGMVEISKTLKLRRKESIMSLWRGNSPRQGTNINLPDRIVQIPEQKIPKSTKSGMKDQTSKCLGKGPTDMDHKKR